MTPAKIVKLRDKHRRSLLSQLLDETADDVAHDEVVFSRPPRAAKESKTFNVENGARAPVQERRLRVYGGCVAERATTT